MKVVKNNLNNITSFKLLVSSDDTYSNTKEFTADVSGLGTAANSTLTATFTIDAPVANQYYRIAIDLPKANDNGWLAVNTINYYGEIAQGTVAAPVITLGENNMVSISQADNHEIRYTIDGTEPTAASNPYSAPFAINGETTVKAVAVNGSELSAVVSKTLKPNTVSSIAAYLDLASASEVKINTPLTAIYQNGRNLYLTDNKGGFILAYNSGDLATVKGQFATNGDVMSYMSGTYKLNNGCPQIIPTAVGEKSAGTAVEPEELTIEELSMDKLNKYVKIVDVKIVAETKANNYTATDETGSVAVYNTFYNANYYDVVTVPEGEGFTMIGFVGCFGTTLQVTPIAIEGGTVVETVETPVFTPASGSELNEGDLITIECATEGAKIYFTTEDETPTTASQLYEGPISFTEAITLKAIAVKEGMNDSYVATASYTKFDPNATSAMFDFTNPATLNPAPEIPTASNTQIKLKEANGNNVFAASNITLTFGDGENTSNSPVIIYPTATATKGNIEGRIYQKNVMTFTAMNGAKITKIVFTQRENSTNWAGFTCVPEANPAATATDRTFNFGGVSEVVLTSIGTSRFGSVEVEYDASELNAIDGIDADNSNAPVEYFNLQGIRVNGDNLIPGIYVRRQGSNVVKVLVK